MNEMDAKLRRDPVTWALVDRDPVTGRYGKISETKYIGYLYDITDEKNRKLDRLQGHFYYTIDGCMFPKGHDGHIFRFKYIGRCCSHDHADACEGICECGEKLIVSEQFVRGVY